MSILKVGFIGLAFLASSAWGAANDFTHYTIFIQGKKGGEQSVEHLPDGLTKVHFEFKDNGRGPTVDEEYHLASDGTMADYSAKGTTTFGSIIDEHYTLRGHQAEWHSNTDKGSQAIKGPALYIPLNGSFQMAAVNVGALVKRPEGSLPLLPSGQIRQRKLAEVTLKDHGKSRQVQLFMHTGLDYSPSFYWVNKGQPNRLFALVVPGWMFVVEDGWTAVKEQLEVAQKAQESKLLLEMANRLQHPMHGLTLIHNARVFDSEKATLGSAADLYVLRGKITAVLPVGSPSFGVDQTIDAGGRVLLPGLFDMHGHVDRWSDALHLAAGVTSVRDMGNVNAELQGMMDETAEGKLLGPQMVPAGFIEGDSPFHASADFVVKDLADAKQAVDWYNEHGYPQLKVYNSFPKEILAETVAYAHSRGMRVSGHVPAFLRAQDVIDRGFDEIQHINQVLLNFLVTPTTDTRTLDRFYLPAEKVAGLDFDSKPVVQFLKVLKDHQTVIDSTISTFSFLGQREGEISPSYEAVADHLPLLVKRQLYQASMKIPDDATAERYKKSYAKMVEFVGRMYRAGVPLVAGTDATPGFTLQHELASYVKAGLTPSQALQVATVNGAKYTRTSFERGSIAPGKLADLVLVDGDPTVNIGDLRKVALVITRGYLLYPNEIYTSLGVVPFVTDPPQPKETKKAKASI